MWAIPAWLFAFIVVYILLQTVSIFILTISSDTIKKEKHFIFYGMFVAVIFPIVVPIVLISRLFRRKKEKHEETTRS